MLKVVAFFIAWTSILSSELKFYSEDGQDKYVYEKFFQNKTSGVFIDIGAHEGISCSNTYFFECYFGWNGICFEPNPVSFEKLVKNRKCPCLQAAISDEKGRKQFVAHPCTLVSGLLEKYNEQHAKKYEIEKVLKNKSAQLIMVDCLLLNDVLREYGLDHVDLLSIDTEGGELDILSSIDFEKYKIEVIVVENIYHDPNYRIFLESKGYSYVTRLHRDEVYKRQ